MADVMFQPIEPAMDIIIKTPTYNLRDRLE